MTGYLQKKGRINTAWQTRWFILSEDKIFYFKNSDHCKPLGYIPLKQAVIRVRRLSHDTHSRSLSLPFSLTSDIIDISGV
jgi:hypothetical protein